jgi:HNH endonuclease
MRFADLLKYEPTTGALVWAVTRNGQGFRYGGEVGSVRSDGRYRTFVMNGKRRYCHRVIWEMLNGPIPDGLCIDHIDGNGLNNRIENLRAVTLSENQRNRRLDAASSLGIHGVRAHRGGFIVYCASKYLTWKKDFFEACCARKSAERANNYHLNNGRI